MTAQKIRSAAGSAAKTAFSLRGAARLFTAWMTAAFCSIVVTEASFNEAAFFDNVSMPAFALLTFAVWAVLCFVKSEKAAGIIMIAVSEALAIAAASNFGSFMFLAGLTGAVALVICFVKTDGMGKLVNMQVKWICAAVLASIFIVFVGLVCCMKYRNYFTSCYDFGIFSQAFYYLKETGLPLSTCERDGLLSHFAVHFSPVLYLLVPVYIIFPHPETLLVAQAVVVASGVIPTLLICRKKGLSNAQSLAAAVCYLALPCFAGGSFYYFHENCFLAPLAMWLIYFCETENSVLSVVSAVLMLSVKEDAAVYAAVIALYFAVCKKGWKCCLVIFVVAVVYFLAVTHFLASSGLGVMTWRYKNYMYDDSGSLLTIFKSVAVNPVFTIAQCFTTEKLLFILQMLLPLGLLPICLKHPKELVLLIPFVLVNLMTNYGYQYNIGYQYAFGSGSILVYLAIVNSRNFRVRGKMWLIAACSAVIIFVGTFSHQLDTITNYPNNSERRAEIGYALSLVPDDASVAVSTFFLPNLSQRDEIYELETTKQTAEYYVLDLRFGSDAYSVSDYQTPQFEQVYLKDGMVAVFKNLDYRGE